MNFLKISTFVFAISAQFLPEPAYNENCPYVYILIAVYFGTSGTSRLTVVFTVLGPKIKTVSSTTVTRVCVGGVYKLLQGYIPQEQPVLAKSTGQVFGTSQLTAVFHNFKCKKWTIQYSLYFINLFRDLDFLDKCEKICVAELFDCIAECDSLECESQCYRDHPDCFNGTFRLTHHL